MSHLALVQPDHGIMDTPHSTAAAWADALDAWATSLRAAGRPDTTIQLRRHQLTRLARAVEAGPWDLTAEDLTAYAGARTWARDTRRSFRSAVRGFYDWGIRTGRLTGPSPADALPSVRAQPPAPHPTSDADLLRALTHATPGDRLAIRLASEAGLRRGEVVQVHARDIHHDGWGWSLTVHGKGDRDRTVPLSDGLAATLRDWCDRHGGWAYPGRTGAHMTAHALGKRISRLLPDGVSMHSLRHRFASRAYARTSDLLTVQQLLGHTSPATTQRYVLIDGERHRRVALAAAA